MKSLYIHIPFCDQICFYCDFPKRIANEPLKIKYIDYLVKELSYHNLEDLVTIYIGGGTPSSLSLQLIDKLLKVLPDVKEFTFECNPNDITTELLELIKQKVTRISLGVQTFDDELLKSIGRKHNSKDSVEAIKLINSFNFDLSIDLMFNLPKQTLDQVKFDLDNTNDIGHISYYSLILEEKTIFSKMLRNNEITLNEDNEFYEYIIEDLQKRGFEQYEISNFSKTHKSIHNLTYWNNEKYIGCGLAASGYDKTRYKNFTLFKDYFSSLDEGKLPIMESNEVTKKDEMFNHMMLGFRLLDGIDILHFSDRYKIDVFTQYPELKNLVCEQYLKQENGKIKLTRKGLLFNNDLLVRLL